MLLHGPFEVLDFSEILRLLATKGETGRLEVARAGVAAKLYFAHGRLTWAEVEERHPTVPTDSGPYDQLVDACARFVHSERGSFEFEPGVTSPSGSYTEAEVERILALAKVRATEWREIAAVLPSLDVHPALVPDVVDEPVILTRDLWRLVTAIDGRRSVTALARVTGMSTLAVCRLLKRLVEDGAISVDDPPRAEIEAKQIEEAGSQAEAGLIKIFTDRHEPKTGDPRVDQGENESGSVILSEPGDQTDSGPKAGDEEKGGDRRGDGRGKKSVRPGRDG